MITRVQSPYTSKAYSAFSTQNAEYYSAPVSSSTKKEKKKISRGAKIAMIIAGTGFGILALTKGLPRSARKWFDGIYRRLEDKIAHSENKQLNKIQTAYIATLKHLKMAGRYIKLIYNTAPLKDVLIKTSLSKVKLLEKAGNWTTKMFERVSIATAKRGYKKSSNAFQKLFNSYGEINKRILEGANSSEIVTIKGVQKTRAEWVQYVESKCKTINSIYDTTFSPQQLNSRVARIKKEMSTIDKQVWGATYGDIKAFFKNKKTYTTYIPDEFAVPAKLRLNEELSTVRNQISNSTTDNYATTKKLISNVSSYIDPSDKATRNVIRNLRHTLEEYKLTSQNREALKFSHLNTTLSNELDELSKVISNNKLYSSKQVEEVTGYLSRAKEVIRNNKKGEIQEILTVYNKLIDKGEYDAIRLKSYDAVKVFDKSIDLEADKLFDKIRDLLIGAAPTDSIGVLGSVAVTGWFLAKSDNVDERISVALKYGIPAIGAVAVSLYCTLGLVAGGASLAIGMLSGLVINQIGVMADKLVKRARGTN